MTIKVKNLTFEAILGILEKERVAPQKLLINCKISYAYKEGLFLDYREVIDLIEKTIKERKFFLIEEALNELSLDLKSKFPNISSIKLKISKPSIFDNCEVCVEKKVKY